MRELAGGNFDVVLPGLGRRDEIGEMAAAVEEFKMQAIAKAERDAAAHDAQNKAAGAAFYGGLTVVPSVLVAVSLARLVLGPERLHAYGTALAGTLPSAIGADAAAQRVLDAGVTLTPLGIAFAVVVGSAYGEGLSRALARFAPADPDVRVAFARTLLTNGDIDRAEKEIRTLASSFPKSASVQVQLGALLLARRDPAGARAAFNRALELNTASPDAMRNPSEPWLIM